MTLDHAPRVGEAVLEYGEVVRRRLPAEAPLAEGYRVDLADGGVVEVGVGLVGGERVFTHRVTRWDGELGANVQLRFDLSASAARAVWSLYGLLGVEQEK